MTTEHDDQELFERIRRATDHFSFERPAPSALGLRRGARVGRFGSLVAAAAFGAAVTLVALAVLRPQGPPTGSQSPSPNPSRGPVSTPGLESPAPRGTEVPLDAAQRTCLSPRPDSIPDEWLASGETFADINAHLAGLPLAQEEQRSHAGLFVFADERFLILCEMGRRTDGQGDVSIIGALRETSGTPIGYSGGTNLPASIDDAGNTYLADLLMYGPAAANVTRVEVLLEDGSAVEASLGGGVWVGWWNRSISAVGVRATLDDGTTFLLDATMKATVLSPEGTGAPARSEAPAAN
ncbi:MAG TPA: hypothetical protein VL687_05800 [Methylomirabilota bacterium]|jgi:hypothetical protein|nr:hypothetical protein [Methylomirabilota bacterium]